MKKKIAFVLCVAMLLSMVLAGCSKTIAIETDLTNLELEGEEEGKTGEVYTATLVPEDEDYVLPEEITVKVDGSKLSDKKYTYDPESGELTIPGEEITGDIEIIAEGVELTVVGTWKGTIDLTDELNELISSADPAMAEFYIFSDIAFDMVLELNEDGECVLSADEDSAVAMANDMQQQMVNCTYAFLEAMIAEMGYDMSVDEFLGLQGLDMESFADELFPVEELASVFTDLTESGTYEVEDDALFLSLSDFSADGNPYTLKGDSLTIEAAGDEDEASAILFPMVLKRVG